MSEAELHLLRARMRGGLLSKAQRGELRLRLPVGFVYDEDDRVVLDPDRQVQQALRHLFETFRRTGAASATMRQFHREGVLFPRQPPSGQGELVWKPLERGTVGEVLHNARYAGAFHYGASKTWKDLEGKVHHQPLPIEQWPYLIKKAHAGYISWEEFLANQDKLSSNAQSHKLKPGPNAAREGPALLQGIVLCGFCGNQMRVQYARWHGEERPVYACYRAFLEKGESQCQRMPGQAIDDAVGGLVVASVNPMALEVVLSVQSEVEARLAEADRLRRQQVERAQYEADQARVRYLRVDPNNRLVADNLERLWNEKLTTLAQAQEEYERGRSADRQRLSEAQRQEILQLAEDFPKLWREPTTAARDRKRLVRLLVEDVTLKRTNQGIGVYVRFKGGAVKELHLPKPVRTFEARKTKAPIIRMIDELLENHDEPYVAQALGAAGFRSTFGHPFDQRMVGRLCTTHKLLRRSERLRKRGLLTGKEVAKLLGVRPIAVPYWREIGLLKGLLENPAVGYFYQVPSTETVETIRARTRRPSLGSQPSSAV
jgi:hypothetical protein